jgi:hypothetical protein
MGAGEAQSKEQAGEEAAMRAWHILSAAMILTGSAGAAQNRPYQPLANPPDPVAQRDELIALYDEICLRAFPDEAEAGRAAARHDATPLSPADVRRFLHDDPGFGWQLRGRTGRFDVTIEQSPPYHACAVRTMTANGFADLSPYQALAARYERAGGFVRITPMNRTIQNLHIIGGGEQRPGPGGSSEALLVAITSASDEYRARGDTAIEVRFAHQYVGAQPAKPAD